MKKIYILMLAVMCVFTVAGQTKYAQVKTKAVPARAIKNQDVVSKPVNSIVHSKAALEDIIGTTWYDMQTNAAIDPRLTLYPDGTMGGVWIRGTTNSAERGTGYNYYTGTSWGPSPSSRIENDRTGWPSYAPLGPNGEIVIAHLNDGLKISKRDTKGQGTWNQSVMMGPAGATDISWPRIMTSGPNHNYIHMLVNTYVVYEGLDLAILYYRSSDGGLTWEKNGVVLPQMSSADYDGFNGDQMAWGTPHGDTIYFVVSGPWVDTFIMVSYDNGDNWNKIPILSNANKKLAPGVTSVPPFRSSDGACVVEMDNSGIFHVAFGIGGGYMEGDKYIFVNSNGLVYWNSTMPMVKDSLDLDTLDAHGQLLGAVYNGPNPGDTLLDVPGYRVGLSSWPQIAIDEYNNLYFFWSAATPGNPSPDNFNYRHIWGRAKYHSTGWTPQQDLNGTVLYLFREFAYPTLAKRMLGGNLHLLYQTAPEPGSNIVNSSIVFHECDIEHRMIHESEFWPVGINRKDAAKNEVGQIYPNPVKDVVSIPVKLVSDCSVNLVVKNLSGQQVMSSDHGKLTSGGYRLSLNVSELPSGIYFVTIQMGTESVTRKIVVE